MGGGGNFEFGSQHVNWKAAVAFAALLVLPLVGNANEAQNRVEYAAFASFTGQWERMRTTCATSDDACRGEVRGLRSNCPLVLSLVHHDEVITAVRHWCALADATIGGWSENNF